MAETRAGIATIAPNASAIFDHAADVKIEGGFVFAHAQGSLSDPAATLHRRDRFGVARRGRYISVDTGKYSSAPLLGGR